jgi:chaperonin GroES
MTQILPYRGRVLIERIEEPSNIVLTDADKSIKGRVVAVGPGKLDEDGEVIEPDVKVGDLVYFNSRWHDLGSDYQEHQWWDNKNFHLVQEADIFGKVSV